jgi:hypothetical protein
MSIFPHKVTYFTTKQFNDFKIKIYGQIENKDFETISFPPYAVCKIDNNHVLLAEEVRKLLLKYKTYDEDINKTVIRLFGHRQYLEEALEYINWSRIKYDINCGNIKDLNNSNFPILLSYMNIYICSDIRSNIINDMKYLIDNGANINLQDENGRTPLYKFIYIYKSFTTIESNLKLYVEFLEFLLQNGADPLLSDKNGKSPYSILLNEVSDKKKDRIIEIVNDNNYIDKKIILSDIFYSLICKYV